MHGLTCTKPGGNAGTAAYAHAERANATIDKSANAIVIFMRRLSLKALRRLEASSAR